MSFLRRFLSIVKHDSLYFLVIDRYSPSTCIANWVAEPKVFVVVSIGALANLLFHSLTGMFDNSENLFNFLRMVHIFFCLIILGLVDYPIHGQIDKKKSFQKFAYCHNLLV